MWPEAHTLLDLQSGCKEPLLGVPMTTSWASGDSSGAMATGNGQMDFNSRDCGWGLRSCGVQSRMKKYNNLELFAASHWRPQKMTWIMS